MSVFEYEHYKPCVNDWVRSHPHRGYGVYSRMARFLGTSPVVMTQVFKGGRELSLEHAAKLCGFMELGTLETDYFLLLVQRERAGSHDLKQIHSRQLLALRAQGQAIKNRIRHEQLTEEDKAHFYSSWLYIATWLGLTIPELGSVSALARHFRVPEQELADAVRFALDKGLLVKAGQGSSFGKNIVHVPHDSPFVSKHHSNWRLRALQLMDRRRSQDLFYSAPMALSKEVRARVRERLVELVQELTRDVEDSPSEELACLNIDFFGF